jgi:hypothetical protein
MSFAVDTGFLPPSANFNPFPVALTSPTEFSSSGCAKLGPKNCSSVLSSYLFVPLVLV